jgi:hypothetical protein
MLVWVHLAVGDGGYQWRLRKLRRAQEQAQEEGRSVEDVWRERNGVRGGGPPTP